MLPTLNTPASNVVPLFADPAEAHLRRALLLLEARNADLRDGQLALAAQEIRAYLFAQRRPMEVGHG